MLLAQMVYGKLEADAAAGLEELEEGDGRLTEAQEEALLLGGASDFPSQQIASLDSHFTTNVISVACWPGRERAVVGTGEVHVVD